MRSVPAILVSSGSLFLASALLLAVTEAPLGTPLFFAIAAAMGAAYVAVLLRVWRQRDAPARQMRLALLFAVAFRLPLAVLPVGHDSDMMRYLWDGRVQRFGINPYTVVPADPALEYTHTLETRAMPSRRYPTPYPPFAQLFFRAVVTIHDSAIAMKLALLACDLAIVFLVRRWLRLAGRSEWMTLAYAWNPLVVLEVAHSGHIDAFGAFWLVLAAVTLTAGRTMTAAVAFVLAVATKLLPIVLLPLLWRRIRIRDAAVGAAAAVVLLLPFVEDGRLPLGSLPGLVGLRFNGPLYRWMTQVTYQPVAGAIAVGCGILAAAWCRTRLRTDDPAAWAWPMAISLALAPVVYPWYLLYLTPFLLTGATVPLIVWTFTVLSTYIVWEYARHGARWAVPPAVMLWEYLLVAAASGAVAWRRLRRG